MTQELETSRFAAIYANRRRVTIASGMNREYSREPGALVVDHCQEFKGLSERNLESAIESCPNIPKTTYVNGSGLVADMLRNLCSPEHTITRQKLEPDVIDNAFDDAIIKVNSSPAIVIIDNPFLSKRLSNCSDKMGDNLDSVVMAFLTLNQCVFARTPVQFKTLGRSMTGRLNGYGFGMVDSDDWEGFF